MINISSDIANVVATNTASIISQLWGLFAIFLGISIAFYIVRKIISIFTLIK